MIDFRSYLTELFDRPFPVRELKRLGHGATTMEVTYHAVVDDGQDLMVDITNIGKWWEINFTLDGSHELTHAGKPYRILATVIEAVKQFVKWHIETWNELPKQFDMVSKTSEGKRDAVYSAMMRRFGKQYGYEITNRMTTNRGYRPEDQRTVTTAKLAVLPWSKVEASAHPPKGMKWKDPLNPLRGMVPEARDYKAEYRKMYGGDNPTPKQRRAMKKKTARKRVLRRMGREGRSNDGKEIDHKNGNALDSRPSNLRLVARHTNRSKDNNKWRK
jgi:hypothetical protein